MPRGGKWSCCNVHGIEVYRSVTLGPDPDVTLIKIVVSLKTRFTLAYKSFPQLRLFSQFHYSEKVSKFQDRSSVFVSTFVKIVKYFLICEDFCTVSRQNRICVYIISLILIQFTDNNKKNVYKNW